VWRHRGHLLFASEIRALLASGLVTPRLDRVALGQFLAYQTVPTPRTLVEHVEMIPPATLLTAAADGDVRVRSYWDLLPAESDPSPDGARVAVRTRELLAESTECHLVSDVPVGVFLSGGIDSTAIATLVRQSGATPRTFAITFPGTSFDEAPYAAAAARACRAEHTEIALSEANVLADIIDAIATVDHPSGDGVNTFIVSKAVRDAGIKVALSGLGGDEFFGGYPSFDRLRRFGRYARAWGRSPASMRRMAGATLQRVAGRSVATAKAAALLETDGTVPQTFPILRQLFDRGSRDALLGRDLRDVADAAADPYVGILEHASARRPDADIMTLVSFAEARTYMHDVLLRDTDQMSMRHGLEVRVPLLDHRLVEHLMALPEAAKRPAVGPKPLLIEALGDALPAECVRRKKQGFVLPFDVWMRGPLRPFCDRHLGPRSVVSNTLNGDAVSRLWQSFLASDGSTTWSRPWALVALDAWMERTGVGM
jgi:asparagine synthase (glutamine-hydrolysing)